MLEERHRRKGPKGKRRSTPGRERIMALAREGSTQIDRRPFSSFGKEKGKKKYHFWFQNNFTATELS